jgi:hypothetical protein
MSHTTTKKRYFPLNFP